MTNFKRLIIINLFLLLCSQTVNSDEKTKPISEPNTDNKGAIIKFSPNYKKSDLKIKRAMSYKKAINIELGNDMNELSEDELQKLGEERCRKYNLHQRKNYFVNFIITHTGNVKTTVFCSEVDGLIIEDKPKN